MKKSILLFFFLFFTSHLIFSQKNIRTFIFGHSLIHHEWQVNPTPSQETSVPHWFHFLAAEAGHDYAVSGQYGFLPQHMNVPPIAQWGFDFVEGAWDSDNELFSAAGFNTVLLTAGNFMQWQPPAANYPNENFSPIDATTTIFDWCMQQEDSLTFYIYENWSDMGAFLGNGFPPTTAEWNDYIAYQEDDFHDWWLEYHDAMMDNFPNACVRMIPVGYANHRLLQQSPFNQIPIDELYEDDAPHGRATIYFLSALTTYMAMYEEKAPASYQVEDIIHPIIRDNYTTVVDFLWDELLNFDDANGVNRVFCDEVMTDIATPLEDAVEVSVFPNPTTGELHIDFEVVDNFRLDLYSVDGQVQFSKNILNASSAILDLENLSDGIYFLSIKNDLSDVLFKKKIVVTRG